MMNMRNPGSKENLAVKFKEGICAKFCLKLWFESGWFFCNITKSGWFWKRLSRKKVLNNHFIKLLKKQLYGDVLQNRCSSKFRDIHIKASMLLSRFNKFAGLYLKETSAQVFPCEYCKIFTNRNRFFYRTPPVAAFVSLIK